MLREKRRHANSKPNRKNDIHSARLDRKSSRGMIYENEELRLRTININAEVERGQSDIKKLRRENDHLRREIWSLRDEYDRLDKLLRSNQGIREGGERSQDDYRTTVHEYTGPQQPEDDDEEVDEEEEEEEPICDRCQQFEESCECALPSSDFHKLTAGAATFRPRPPPRDKPNFDDLSVVSEETTHSTDTVVTDPDAHRLSLNAPPLGAFEFQSDVPSLAHFENLCYEKIGPNLTSSGELVFDENAPLPDPPSRPPSRPLSQPNATALSISISGDDGVASEGTTSPTQSLVSASLALTPALSPSIPEAFQDTLGPPDICMYASGHSAPLRMRSRGHNGGLGRFPTGGNLDDLLHDLDNLTVDHSLMSCEKKRKQRSEMNLVLTIDGAITPVEPITTVPRPPTPSSVLHPSPKLVPVESPVAPPLGWKPILPPKSDKPPKPKFPWITRGAGPLPPTSPTTPILSDCTETSHNDPPTTQQPALLTPQQPQSGQRRKSISTPNGTDQPQSAAQQNAKSPATATISKRRFSLRRNSDTASAGAKPVPVGPGGAGGGGGSSAERNTTTTHSVSSSPESSTSMSLRSSQRPQPRRISTGSHDNATGSIPWCACWGNGCI